MGLRSRLAACVWALVLAGACRAAVSEPAWPIELVEVVAPGVEWYRTADDSLVGGVGPIAVSLLRLDPDQGEVWLNENNLLAGVKMLMGIDPKKDYQDKVAQVDLR